MNLRDIELVDRLRIVWTSCPDRVNDERAEAADEIERLRNELESITDRLTAERDEARRRYCTDVWQGIGDEDEQRQLTPREIARREGWNCFNGVNGASVE